MKKLSLSLIILTFVLLSFVRAAETGKDLKDLSINGGVQDGKARLVIEARIQESAADKQKLLFATSLEQAIQVSREKLSESITVTFDILQGEAAEIPLSISGEGEIKKVTGEHLQDWSVRQETNGLRTLVLRPRKGDKPVTKLSVTILAERDLRSWSNPVQVLVLTPPQPSLFHGYVKIVTAPELSSQASNSSGLVPIETKYLPEALRAESQSNEGEPLAFRFQGAAFTLPLNITVADPEARRVVLRDFQLQGQLTGQSAAFTLTAVARVKNPQGGALALLSGAAALAELEPHPDWRLNFTNGQFVIVFNKAGEFPLRIKFNATVRQAAGSSGVDFRVAPSAVQPITLTGLAADTQFDFSGGARPERQGDKFVSFLPPDGTVRLSWKETRPEVEGKLFYAAEMLSQVSISPGLMRQVALLEGKIMQGELNRVSLLVRGQGNVTAVQGANVLSWNVEAIPNTADRRLIVQFNQPRKDAFNLQVQMQTELGAFPQGVDAMQLRPEGATRFAGYFRVVNQGAVRLEVLQSTGLSQISPEQFPESDTTKALLPAQGNQRFAFRFSSVEFALRIQADNILPELSVSELIVYNLGETELAIDAELELDIREAPLREVLIRVPKGYAIARLNAAGMSDYFLREPADQPDAELRLVYGQPVTDRQVVQLRLERNGALGQATWTLPLIEVVKAKSTRGHIAVSADAGFRLTADRTQGLTDIATAFFPRKVAGIQTAFRLSDPAWQAAMRVERLPQSIQADVFHLFSIGEGIAYGSSTITYQISGAPVSAFRVTLSEEYFNVEFTGKDVRNWQKTAEGYLVQLHTPVSGSYTLLATCERPFKSQGDTLTFTGARPLDAQTEQGYTLVVSTYQFQVDPVNVSPGLLPLETAEVPPEFRLFFDAPILTAYRYTSRPFNLQLALKPFAQGETLSLVVDRAVLKTRISKDGEVLTDARYFVKSRGNPHLRLTLPEGTTLWSATLNGSTVVPVKDGGASLIPLPQRGDPNAVQTLELKLASRSRTASRVSVAVPIVAAPVLLAEWKVEPDTGQRLVYRNGSLVPVAGVADVSGFAGLARLFSRGGGGESLMQLLMAFALVVFAVWVWHWASSNGIFRFSARHMGGALVGLAAVGLAMILLMSLRDSVAHESQWLAGEISFLAPVQQSGSALSVDVANLQDEFSFWRAVGQAWPALLAVLLWAYAWIRAEGWIRSLCVMLGWTVLAWTTLRWPNGAPAFFILLLVFLLVQVVIPGVRSLFRVPLRPAPPAESAAASAGVALLIGSLMVLGVGQIAGALEGSGGPVPLTPALSRGERENDIPVPLQTAALDFSVGPFQQSGDEANDDGTPKKRPSASPLPKGEGQGEGERDSRPQSSFGFTGNQNTFRGNSIGNTDDAGISLNSNDSFPLTPALSRGERENDIPVPLQTAALDFSVGPFQQSGDEANDNRTLKKRASASPLPKGEGQGEGERDSRPQSSFGFTGNQNTFRENSIGNTDDAGISLNSNGSFPLTPALSPGERENHTPVPLQVESVLSGMGFSGKSVLMAQAAGGEKPARRNGSTSPQKDTQLPESVTQEIRVEEKFAFATARVRWHATKGQVLPVLFEPAVLTGINYPTNALRLVQAPLGSKRADQLVAQEDGTYDIELQYQIGISQRDGQSGFALPTQPGLVNRLTLTLTNLDVDVLSANAVSVQRDPASTNTTIASLVLAPASEAWIGWKPRSRDVRREKAVFFAELAQLYVPAAGVIEGVHQVQIRPAQGELNELVIDVPTGATITDVSAEGKGGVSTNSSIVSLWRFDPDSRKLRVSLNPPQSRPFTIFVRSQVATGPLPLEQTLGLLSVNNAAGQLGSIGIATGSEVQLDTVTADAFSAINLEDFPPTVLQPLAAQVPGLTLRRGFHYADASGALTLKASAVEPDVRVETQETLSLGEDRTVLAANATVTVTRAGIFRISFVLPPNLDVESISGAALSHWTELKAPEGRIITLHLKGKTEGQQQFAVSLSGPGTKAAKGVAVPHFIVREASKQRGQIVIVPEQGMRLQVVTRDGVTQLDPQKAGIRQKGVLAFRLLQPQWNLTLDIEQVDAWVQVASLQHVTVNEAQVKVAANLQFQIENTGLKALHVRVPTNAENVRFRGEQLADFLPVPGQVQDGMQTWELKLHRRMIGKYLLQANWQIALAEASTNMLIHGVQAVEANLQRGFLTVRAAGRLQVRADQLPPALQAAEWQSIPRPLRQDIEGAAADYTFRLVEPGYQLTLRLERHEATKLLQGRVNSVTLSSVISDEGVMLTQVKMELVPGDKRLLKFSLPPEAHFWFAFVNQNGVWPWLEQDRILVPLEQQSQPDKPTSVELFYSSRIGAPGTRKLDLALLGPKFDLPLENITWQVYLNEKWHLKKWTGTLQLQEASNVPKPTSVDVQSYLQNEVSLNREKTKVAEGMLAMGNSLLERGDPQQARRAFQSAYGLSAQDEAFNEDARVQLHNLKLQQALIGLNVRQGGAGEGAAKAERFRDLRGRKGAGYTQDEAKQIMDGNTADDNAALMRLAERLLQQQDAAVSSPAAIRAAIPEQGRLLTFRRSVQVDASGDLRLRLAATAARPAPWDIRIGTLLAILAGFGLLRWIANRMRPPEASTL